MVACYYKNDDNPSLIRTINSGVCMGSGSASGVFSCCFPWDTCLPSGFCHTNTTYYTALCTDQTLQDSVCQHGCAGLYRTGLIYDNASARWTCCDQSDTTCSTGTNATFEAPAPQVLLAKTMTIVDFIPSSTASASTSSGSRVGSATGSVTSSTAIYTTSSSTVASSGSAATSTKLPSNANQETTSLSTGAKAGIGAGIALVVSAIIAVAVFWVLRKKKKRRNALVHSTQTPVWAGEMPADSHRAPVYEKYTPKTLVEADSSTSGSVYNHQNQRRLHEMG